MSRLGRVILEEDLKPSEDLDQGRTYQGARVPRPWVPRQALLLSQHLWGPSALPQHQGAKGQLPQDFLL